MPNFHRQFSYFFRGRNFRELWQRIAGCRRNPAGRRCVRAVCRWIVYLCGVFLSELRLVSSTSHSHSGFFISLSSFTVAFGVGVVFSLSYTFRVPCCYEEPWVCSWCVPWNLLGILLDQWRVVSRKANCLYTSQCFLSTGSLDIRRIRRVWQQLWRKTSSDNPYRRSFRLRWWLAWWCVWGVLCGGTELRDRSNSFCLSEL